MRALIADDDRLTSMILSNTLQQCGLEVLAAHDGLSAWEMLDSSSRPPSIAILDWEMPGLSGPELCGRIRAESRLANLYLILLTARHTSGDVIEGLDAGADEYMIKSVTAGELRARIRVAMRMATLQDRLAEQVRELRIAHEHMAMLVSTDALTGVSSRRDWFDRAAAEFARSRRHDRALSVMMIDIDYFKKVNDQYGHPAGDQLLSAFAGMLRRSCRESDVVGRLGGEEFALLVPETTAFDAVALAARINAASRSLVVTTPEGPISCTCSIGIGEMLRGDEDVACVLRRADAALYDAKRAGRDRFTSATAMRVPA
jgi:two-component system, cell cycle response regulator